MRYSFSKQPGLGIIVLICCWSIGSLNAQNTRYVLMDSTDHSPIPYAHILSTNYQTISNLDGEFIIPDQFRETGFAITCIGFNDQPFRPENSSGSGIYLQRSTEFLDPVVISSITPAEMVFKAVENMNMSKSAVYMNADYWYAVEENDMLKGYKIAFLKKSSDDVDSDSVIQTDTCTEYDLDTFTDDQKVWDQFHINPPLACLNKRNQDLWRYTMAGTIRNADGTTEVKVVARFISPENYVAHQYAIWINLDEFKIGKIEYSYQWNIDHPVTILNSDNKESALKNLEGIILFHDRMPMYMDVKYGMTICDKIFKSSCDETTIYHELRMRNISGMEAMNGKLYTKIQSGITCDD